MWRFIKWILGAIGILMLLAILFITQPWAYLPHKHIEISLPFAPEDDAYTHIIPMGEIEQWHNASTGLPNGHPGIDFQWNKETGILAVADGRIMNIRKNEEDKYIVEQSLGFYYRTVYQELNTLAPDLRFGSKLKRGQLIGYSGFKQTDFSGPPKPTDPSIQIHWDFSSWAFTINRICPLGYFDEDSRKRIEAIWAGNKAQGEYKKEYPDICNGFYKNREF